MKPMNQLIVPVFEQIAFDFIIENVYPSGTGDSKFLHYKPDISGYISNAEFCFPEAEKERVNARHLSESERSAINAMEFERLTLSEDFADVLVEVPEDEAELNELCSGQYYILEVNRRMPLDDGRCLVRVEVDSYRVVEYYWLLIDTTEMTVTDFYSAKASF